MTFGNVEQNFAVSTTKLFEASLNWWKAYRPRAYTLSQHLDDPHINMKTKADRELATEIVTILRNEVME
jgi:hypothetical protein